jgi:hypothetical protein
MILLIEIPAARIAVISDSLAKRETASDDAIVIPTGKVMLSV